MHILLALGDEVPSEREMVTGGFRPGLEELGGGVQLQRDAGQGLFQSIVQLLGEAGSLG